MTNIVINIGEAKTKKDILDKFQEFFQFAFAPTNWDSFFDSLRSLDTESATFKKSFPNEKHIHIIIKNSRHVKKLLEKEYFNLLDILATATNKSERYDGLNFTFELVDNDK